MLQGRDGFGAQAEPRHFITDVSQDAGQGPVSAMIGAVTRAMSDDVDAQLRARQVDAIRRLTPPLMIVNLVNVSVFMAVLALAGQLSTPALLWSSAVIIVAARELYKWRRTRGKPAPRTASTRTVGHVVASALIFGLIWSVPALTFLHGLTGFAQLFAYLLITGMFAGGAFGLYPIPAAATAFLLPVAVSANVTLWLDYGAIALAPALIAVMFIYVLHQVIRRHADLFVSEFRGRLELEKRNRLIEDLLDDARIESLGTRQLIEERLARAQKVEAIGQLTGGIAHNFNNLLAAIQGYAELLAADQKSDPTLVEPILNGCRQGAEQVQRLLSIAGKQKLYPERIEIASLVEDMMRVLEPALGARYRLQTVMAASLKPAYVDPVHLERALVNLVFNARDAMPDGGEIVVSGRNAPERSLGQRRGGQTRGTVEISVGDHGKGMDAETRERATDPFFTTKAGGLGAGLGLSSVAGFARQSKGDLSIDSVSGSGTCVTLRLPAATEADPSHPEEAPAAQKETTVLLVEDYDDVRAMTVHMLQNLGYAVVTAQGPDEALMQIAGDTRIDLVLTDILLSSEVTGLQLARDLRLRRPELPVTFMSGWARQDDGDRDGSAETSVLPKPFTSRQLDLHLRRALASASLRAAGVSD